MVLFRNFLNIPSRSRIGVTKSFNLQSTEQHNELKSREMEGLSSTHKGQLTEGKANSIVN